MRRVKPEHLETTGMIEENRSTEKQCEKILCGLTEWTTIG